MTLPIIPRAQFIVKHKLLPNGQVVLRPMTVGSENILLQVKDSKEVEEILTGVKQVLEDCVADKIEVGTIPLPFIELLFMKVVSKSSGEIRDLSYVCKNEVRTETETDTIVSECGNKIDVKLDLDQVTVEVPEGFNDVVDLGDGLGFKLKMLSLDQAAKLSTESGMLETIAAHIDCIYQGDNVWSRADVGEAEVMKFVKGMSMKIRDQVVEQFLSKQPKLRHSLKFKCPKCGHDHEVVLEGLQDFFG